MSNAVEIILFLKISLLVILVLGLLVGYFYKQLKERELYLPTIEELKQKIEYQSLEIDKIEELYQERHNAVEEDRVKLYHIRDALQASQEEVINKEKIRVALEHRHNTLRQTYQEKDGILNYYEKEMDVLRSVCRIKSPLSIHQDREHLEKRMLKKKKLYNQVRDKFHQLNEELQSLIFENEQLEEKRERLAKELREETQRYQSYQQQSRRIISELEEEYLLLQQEQEERAKRLKSYQLKIEKLRMTQG